METDSTCVFCSFPLENKRSDARFCSAVCRVRASRAERPQHYALYARDYMRDRRRKLRPHPYRDTPQYKQSRDIWPEYVGFHWADRESDDWDRYLRRSGQQYATAY